jgi:hypothetical protein
MKTINNIATNELHICTQEPRTIWGSSGTLLWLVADRFKRNFPAFRIDQSQGRRCAVCHFVQSERSCLREWRNGWVSGAFGSSATICHCCPASKCTILNPLNAELNPICHLLVLLGDLTFMGPCILSIFQYISNKMQGYTVYLYLETALHVSGGTSTHHQEGIQLYLQDLVFVTPLLLSAAIVE